MGKKQEFGDGRSRQAIGADIQRGRQRLVDILGAHFTPIFTPPWNRCGKKALACLQDLGFHGLSRSSGSHPQAPRDLPACDVNVDLHTRKEASPERGWENLLEELSMALGTGRVGIMLHHQRMNDAAFRFLELLLQTVIDCRDVHPVHLGQLK